MTLERFVRSPRLTYRRFHDISSAFASFGFSHTTPHLSSLAQLLRLAQPNVDLPQVEAPPDRHDVDPPVLARALRVTCPSPLLR